MKKVDIRQMFRSARDFVTRNKKAVVVTGLMGCALLEKETLSGDDVRGIVGRYGAKASGKSLLM